MKKLYIVRHAKSSWNIEGISDKERPLLVKGEQRTKMVIDYFKEKELSIDLIISSAAVRAYETAKIIAKSFQYQEDRIRVEDYLYSANAEQMFDIFYDIPDEIDSVMIVAHNPTVTNFANIFLTQKIDWLPTSGVVALAFDVDNWGSCSVLNSKELFYVTPKMLKLKGDH